VFPINAGYIESRQTFIGQKKPALKSKSDIAVPLKNTSEELTASSTSLLSKNTQPVYNPKGKIDPFHPLFADRPKDKNGILVPADIGRINKTALEKIDLSQLKLTSFLMEIRGFRLSNKFRCWGILLVCGSICKGLWLI